MNWLCGRCGRWRHVMDIRAHVIDRVTERRCRNPRHLRCRLTLAVSTASTSDALDPAETRVWAVVTFGRQAAFHAWPFRATTGWGEGAVIGMAPDRIVPDDGVASHLCGHRHR